MSRTDLLGDLLLVVGIAGLTTVALLVDGVPVPVEWLLGGCYLLVVPGYAFVSALFPRSPSDRSRLVDRSTDGPPWTVRIALSLVGSALAVGAVGAVLGWTIGITLLTAFVALDALTLAAVAVAGYRRLQLEGSERVTPLQRVRPALAVGETTGQRVAIFAAVLVLASTLAFAGAAPPSAEGYSEVTLLSENRSGGLVADGYPTTLPTEETLYLRVENAEGQQTAYSGVVLAQAVGDDGSVTAQERLDEFSLSLEDGESETLEPAVAPSTAGEGVRLRVLVYEGALPESPGVETADHELHLWVDVVPGES